MVLLAQLFRHKSASPAEAAEVPRAATSREATDVRGVGAIAAAVGVKTEHGMPAEFSLSLGELLARVPQYCVWPGGHDAARVVRIPSAEVAPGLARGKAELSLARLVALAPDVFRWERSESDIPLVRLPIQKLLQQIRSEVAVSPPPSFVRSEAEQNIGQTATPLRENLTSVNIADGSPVIAGEVPPLIFEPREPAPVLHFMEMASPPDLLTGIPAQATSEIETSYPASEMREHATVPPTGVPQTRAMISFSSTGATDRPVELRSSKDVGISTTLRAVVLGGITPSAQQGIPGPAAQILAPRVAPSAPPPASPVILGPSVLPSASDAGATRKQRTAPDFAGLQTLFMTGAALDLQGVAALAAALPGVRACVISGSAGSASAGNFSHGVSAEELRLASAGLARIGGAATEMSHREESDIALFLHDEVCVAAVLTKGGFVPGVRERLARVAELLAGTHPSR